MDVLDFAPRVSADGSRIDFRLSDRIGTPGCAITREALEVCRRAPMQVARSRRSRTVESVSPQSRKEKCVLAPVIRCDLPATILSPGVRPTPRRHRQFESLLSTGLSSATNNKRTTVQLLIRQIYGKSASGREAKLFRAVRVANGAGFEAADTSAWLCLQPERR